MYYVDTMKVREIEICGLMRKIERMQYVSNAHKQRYIDELQYSVDNGLLKYRDHYENAIATYNAVARANHDAKPLKVKMEFLGIWKALERKGVK